MSSGEKKKGEEEKKELCKGYVSGYSCHTTTREQNEEDDEVYTHMHNPCLSFPKDALEVRLPLLRDGCKSTEEAV